MQIDVFTLLPHAFSWLTEQRPLAAVLGSELELQLLNYRDFTPLSGGQVDDEPYGGGAGMVLRVDVVYAALEAVYGAERDRRVIAFSRRGASSTRSWSTSLRARELTLLSARFGGSTSGSSSTRRRTSSIQALRPLRRRAAGHGRPRRRRPTAAGAIREESAAVELLGRPRGRPGVPAHPAGRVPRVARPGRPSVRESRAHRALASERSRGRSVCEGAARPHHGSLPAPWDTVVDWVLTITIAVAAVLAIKAWVVNPYRIPSSSMEPTLHCAAPEIGCQAGSSDRVLANRFIYRFRDPERGDIVVFDVPERALERCGALGTFVEAWPFQATRSASRVVCCG